MFNIQVLLIPYDLYLSDKVLLWCLDPPPLVLMIKRAKIDRAFSYLKCSVPSKNLTSYFHIQLTLPWFTLGGYFL